MPALSFLQDFRDIVIIVFAIVGLVAIVLAAIFTLFIGFALLKLLRAVRNTMHDGVAPVLDEAQGMVREVRGATEFVSDSMVRPIIRVYSVFAGIRKGVSVFARARDGRTRD